MKIPSFLTFVFYLLTNSVGLSPKLFAEDQILSATVSSSPATTANLTLSIPNKFGTIEHFTHQPQAQAPLPDRPQPLIVHIQGAHGNYEVEKNIQAILHYLTEKYGFDLLLLEGGVGRLDPEFFNLFPRRPDQNLKVADYLAQKAEISGPELFLIERMGVGKKIEAFGIEDAKAYRDNRKAFQKVLRKKEEINFFLNAMHLFLNRLRAFYLNASLQDFLEGVEMYETRKTSFDAFFDFLKKEARMRLNIDFELSFFQKDWPMMTRLFRLKMIEVKLNAENVEKEKRLFLKDLNSVKIKPFLRDRIERALMTRAGRTGEELGNFTDDRVRKTFEDLFEVLPDNFAFRRYPHLRLHIQFLILQSEIKQDSVFEEISRLKGKITARLIQNDKEVRIVKMLADFELLKKLMSLELSRTDYENLRKEPWPIARKKPSALIRRIFSLPYEKTLKDRHVPHDRELDQLFYWALNFYRGAYAREMIMQANATVGMNRSAKKRIVLVTGGFHTEGIKEYFQSRGLSYALITPRMTNIPKENFYLNAMLESSLSPIKTSQIANVLAAVQSNATLVRQTHPKYPEYRRRHLVKAFSDLKINVSGFADHSRTLFSRQYGLVVSEGKPGSFKASVDFQFLPIRLRRSEVRNTIEQLRELKRAILHRPGFSANETQLKLVLELFKNKDSSVRKEALSTLSTLLWPSLAPDLLKSYRKTIEEVIGPYRRDIEHALIESMRFSSILKETKGKISSASLVNLLPLEVRLFGRYGKKEMGMPSSDINELANWVLQNKTSVGVELLQVDIPYDTGVLPSQFERGKFIEIFLYLENLTRPNFFYSGRISNPNDGPILRHFTKQQGGYLSYFFQLSSSALETPETLTPMNFRPHLHKRLRETQLLNFGLLLASLQESYQVFFPGENPSWMDEKALAMAQAYRAFERRFISFLRSYNRYRNPYQIEQLQGPLENQPALEKLHYEMQLSFQDTNEGGFLLEEVLYPHVFPWFYWYDNIPFSDNPWNQKILPRLRAVEAMALHSGETTSPTDIDFVATRGREFVEKSEGISDEFIIMVEAILVNPSFSLSMFPEGLVHLELSELFLDAFDEAGKFFDPFLDTRRYRDETVYYLEKTGQALDRSQIALAHLPEPKKMTPDKISEMMKSLAPDRSSDITRTDMKPLRGSDITRTDMKPPKRSELRFLARTVHLSQKLKVVRRITDEFIEREDSDFDQHYRIVFRRLLSELGRRRLTRQLTSEKLEQVNRQSVVSFNGLLLEKLFQAKDNRFGVTSIAVPKGLSKKRFLQALKEFQPILKNHSGKVLVFTYPGKVSNGFLEGIYERFDQRIFVFEGEADTVLKALYSGNTSGLDGRQNQKWAKRFFPRVAELNAGKVTPAVLSESSLVVGPETMFGEFAIPVAKQFVEKSLQGFSAEDLFRAHLLFALPYASLTQAELIKEIQENAPELDARQEGDSVRLTFNSSQAQSILNLLRAAQYLLKSA